MTLLPEPDDAAADDGRLPPPPSQIIVELVASLKRPARNNSSSSNNQKDSAVHVPSKSSEYLSPPSLSSPATSVHGLGLNFDAPKSENTGTSGSPVISNVDCPSNGFLVSPSQRSPGKYSPKSSFPKASNKHHRDSKDFLLPVTPLTASSDSPRISGSRRLLHVMEDYRHSLGEAETLQLEDTAEVLKVRNPDSIRSPEDVPKLMKQRGISPWAAVLAVSSGVANYEAAVARSESSDPNSPAIPPVNDPPNTSGSSNSDVDPDEQSSPVQKFLHHSREHYKDSPRLVPDLRRPPSRLSHRSGFVDALSMQNIALLNEEEEHMKRDFLLKLARTFQLYGAPSHRLEYHMAHVSKSLGVKAEFILFPQLILISFGGETHRQNTYFLRAPGGTNMGKLAQVNALCETLTQKLIKIDDAVDLLDGLREAKDYPDWAMLLTYPVTSFGIALMLFQISWVESCIAGKYIVFMGRWFWILNLGYHSLIVTFITRSVQTPIHNAGLPFDYLKVTLSSLAAFLPGLSLTIAIIELATRNLVSGTVRLFGALFTAMMIGFGMTIGGALVLWDSSSSTGPSYSPPSQLWAILFYIPMAIGVNVLFQANIRQWPIMTLSSVLGYVTSIVLNLVPQLKSNSTVVTALCALVIGLTGNIYSRITNDVAVAPILSGILIQVPGSLSVKSTLNLFGSTSSGNSTSNIVDGVNFVFQMLTIGMSLAMGLFVATLIVWPTRGPNFKNLTF
ncbi:hypothetical protein HDU83_008775 [Entophlyctis luteolus]|nr:hypothetical protein HDU83_008775 [Entophlyctis luteolus]